MPWTCKGIRSNGTVHYAHDSIHVEDGSLCYECGLSQQEVEGKKTFLSRKNDPSLHNLIAIIIGCLGLALVSGSILVSWLNNRPSQSDDDLVTEPTPPEEINTSPQPNYRDSRHGISLNPSSWELRKNSQDYPPSALTGTKDLFQLLAPDSGQGSYRENILVKIEEIDKNPALDEYASIQKIRLGQLGTFTLEDDRKITIGGQDARQMIYSGFDGEYNLKRRRIVVLPRTPSANPYFIIITYTADLDDYDQFLPNVEEIFESIELY